MADGKLEELLKVLKDATTLEVARQYLKNRGLPHSAGTWDGFLDERLRPAIADNWVTQADIVELITNAEEHGRQHVFLYKARKGTDTWVSKEKLSAWLKGQGKSNLLQQPDYLANPASLTLGRVEYGTLRGVETLKLTFAKTREERRNRDEKREGKQLVVKYDLEEVRQVNVLRLHKNGYLELRIGSNEPSSKLYENAIAEQFQLIGKLLSFDSFRSVELAPAKQHMWDNRVALRGNGELRFNGVKAIDEFGMTLSAASGKSTVDLSAHGQADQAVEQFNGLCEEANVWFLAEKRFQNLQLDREIHVRVCGRGNEFVLGAKCQLEEYEYVLGKLREYLKG